MTALAPESAGDGCALLFEARAAQHGAIESRDERDRRVAAAVAAGDGGHLAAAAAGAISAAIVAAGRHHAANARFRKSYGISYYFQLVVGHAAWCGALRGGIRHHRFPG